MSFFKDLFKKITKKPGDCFADARNDSNYTLNDKSVTEEYLENLEEDLIRSDLGVKISMEFVEELRKENKKKPLAESEVPERLKGFLLNSLDWITTATPRDDTLNVILIVGVNGVGKTTSIGKLANKFKKEGKKVLIAAGDTFRAAAEEQLNIWAKRAGVDIIQLEPGAKSSAVVYKAIEKAKAENYDTVIIDTAGRLQNKANLMEELSKIKQVITKNLADTEFHQETMLVLDASTGSNALSQAEKFNEATELDSIILTKFDGTAKGGIVFSLAHQFKLPVKYIGTGEAIDDISDFDADEFILKYF